MPEIILASLQSAYQPHLFLLNVGLTKEEYESTSKLSLLEKKELAGKIIECATHEEILKIINDLARLEFQVATESPLRTGNRFLGQLIRAYIEHLEKDKFNASYTTENWTSYPIHQKVKALWAIVVAAAKSIIPDRFKQVQDTDLNIIPAFYYQQLLPELTLSDLQQGKRPVELTRDALKVAQFNAELTHNVELPKLLEQPDLNAQLTKIKNFIMATDWQVGNYIIFQGGLMHGNKRVPHRIKYILDLMQQVEAKQLTVEEGYRNIIAKAKEAIDKPRPGRKAATTELYKEIFNHDVLDPNHCLNMDALDFKPK